jgi:hypothetical protein
MNPEIAKDATVEAHRHLGPGLLASVYEHALLAQLSARSIRSCPEGRYSPRHPLLGGIMSAVVIPDLGLGFEVGG